MNPEIDAVTMTLLVIIIAFFAVGLLVAIGVKIRDFSKELDYINIEIRRTCGAERRYWKRKKRRLWLLLLPFYRR